MNSKNHATLSVFNNKSSVLCPNTTHITSQYLALEQLKAHHNMVSHAKGSIDTTAPKSLQSYLSSIDRKKKSYWQPDNQVSAPSALLDDLSHTLRLQRERPFMNGEHDVKIPVSHDENASMSLNKSIQAGIPLPQFNSKVADKISWYLEAVSQGVFQEATTNYNFHRNNSRQSGSLVSLSSSLRSGKVIKGDLMDWHKKNFTSAQRPFSPRILANSSAKSKVLGMRCYNPPQKRKEHSSINSSEASTFESFEDEDQEEEQRNNEGNESEEGTVDELKDDEDEVAEEIKTEDNATYNFTNEAPVKGSKLGSSSHCDWLSEQALRAQIRRKLSSKTNTSRKSLSARAHVSNAAVNSNKLLPKNQEEKYLKILSDVTEDILRSGVYSNSAIKRTIDFHLQFCSNDAEKEKVKQLLEQVFEGLQKPCEDSDGFKHDLTSSEKHYIFPINGPPEKEVSAVEGKLTVPSSEKDLPDFSGDSEETKDLLNNALTVENLPQTVEESFVS